MKWLAAFATRIMRRGGIEWPDLYPASPERGICGVATDAELLPKRDGRRQTAAQITPHTPQALRWAMVRHLDENSATRRRVQAENAGRIKKTLGRGC